MAIEIKIVDYSEKSFAVFGDTKEIKDQFKDEKGSFMGSYNKFLNVEENGEMTKKQGWIFPKKHKEKIENIVKNYLDLVTPKKKNFEDAFINSETEEKKETALKLNNSANSFF